MKEYTLYFPFLSALVALHLSSVAHSLTRLYFPARVTSLFLDQPSFECEWNKVIDSSFLCWNAVRTFPFRILLPHLTGKHCADGSTALLWIVSTEMWMTEAWFGGDTDEVDVPGIPMSVQTSRHLRPGVRGVQAGKEIPLWRWRASRGPACAVRCWGPKEIPLWRWCAVTGRWKGYKLCRHPVGGAQGGMEIHLWSTQTHIRDALETKLRYYLGIFPI